MALCALGRTIGILTCVGLIAALGGCGVRGGLELPPEARDEVAQTATAGAGQGKAKGEAGKPHQPSILDGLLE